MSTEARRTSVDTASNTSVPDKILTMSFNQDSTALAMGTIRGYFLFTITQTNTNDENLTGSIKFLIAAKCVPFEEVRIIERVLSKSFITIVSDQTPRRLNVLDIRKGTELHIYKYGTNITAVRISRSRLVVCLTDDIWIHDMRDLRVVHIIREVPTNTNGLCALSSNDDSPYLAYPKSSVTGEIQIFDTIKLKDVALIHAHDSPLVAMAFDISGAKIASASIRGTVIRVHSALDGSRLFEFRRGVQRAATIYSLAFSPDVMFLAASSNTGTIHVFRLITAAASASQVPNTWTGLITHVIKVGVSHVSQQATDVFTQDRSFAFIHLPTSGFKTTIAMNNLNGKLILFVSVYDGNFLTYEVNTNDGGECKQLSQCNLFELFENSKNEQAKSIDLSKSAVGELTGEYPPNTIRNDVRSSSESSATTTETVNNYPIQKPDVKE